MEENLNKSKENIVVRVVRYVGGLIVSCLEYIGGVFLLFVSVLVWIRRSLIGEVCFGRQGMYHQIVRLGVNSIGIIVVSSSCIGLIMVLQMAPPLNDFGQVEMVANVNAVAVLRELGPLISAIVLTGFAGASIAAELGTMVVGEEIEALESMALNPVRFLVVPRVIATVIGLIVLAVIADVVSIGAGAAMGVWGMDIPWGVYYANTVEQVKLADFLSGLLKAGVFGLVMSLIACHNGLRVTGGAAGVGRATTSTVVHAIVSIIMVDLMFTGVFYALGWN